MRHPNVLLAMIGVCAAFQSGCGSDSNGGVQPDASIARDMAAPLDSAPADASGPLDSAAPDSGTSTAPGECGTAPIASTLGTAVFAGMVSASPNRFEPSCNDFDPENFPSGGEVLFRWQAPATGTYRFDTEGTEIDTVMWIVPDGATACGEGATELGCNDDEEIDEIGFWSLLELTVTAGDIVQILVEGYLADEDSGLVQVNVTSVP